MLLKSMLIKLYILFYNFFCLGFDFMLSFFIVEIKVLEGVEIIVEVKEGDKIFFCR